ncbi:MAG: dihydrolipoamide acetyltransferase family protein [Solirubrobacterales bacterium]|nr:dihydrolipoamide acetyltransferase family protein [Solirubrobacterales bacterium]
MAEIVMPRLSDSMEEGTIVRWLKRDGEEVARGEELVEIETDKATMAYESDLGGTLQITAQEGATLPVGARIAVIGDDDAAPSAAPAAAAPVAEVEAPAPPAPDPPALAAAPSPPAPASEPASGERVKASPIARRIAGEVGLDLHSVSGSGPGGRIVKADVEGVGAAASASASVSTSSGDETSGRGTVTATEPTRTQTLIARRMAESRATVPSFTLQISVDMTTATTLRDELKASASEGQAVPTINDMVVKASALALREQPQANGAWRDGHFEHYSRVNVGVAVAGPGTLVVPTVFDADTKTLAEISTETGELAERVRSGTITPPQTSGGTFTVSNLGMFGVRSFEAVINTPQAAILAVGAVEQRPAVHEGKIEPRMLMELTLACDHRILYGADGATLLARIKALLEAPLSLAS